MLVKGNHQSSSSLLLPSEAQRVGSGRSRRRGGAHQPTPWPTPQQWPTPIFPLSSVGSFRDQREQDFISGQAGFVFQQEEFYELGNAQINHLYSKQLRSVSPAERLGA